EPRKDVLLERVADDRRHEEGEVQGCGERTDVAERDTERADREPGSEELSSGGDRRREQTEVAEHADDPRDEREAAQRDIRAPFDVRSMPPHDMQERERSDTEDERHEPFGHPPSGGEDERQVAAVENPGPE